MDNSTREEQEVLFPHNWSFQKTPRGDIVLMIMVDRGVFAPILGFTEPEKWIEFVEDVKKADKEFVPLVIREAIDITRKGWRIGRPRKPSTKD